MHTAQKILLLTEYILALQWSALNLKFLKETCKTKVSYTRILLQEIFQIIISKWILSQCTSKIEETKSLHSPQAPFRGHRMISRTRMNCKCLYMSIRIIYRIKRVWTIGQLRARLLAIGSVLLALNKSKGTAFWETRKALSEQESPRIQYHRWFSLHPW